VASLSYHFEKQNIVTVAGFAFYLVMCFIDLEPEINCVLIQYSG